MTDQEIENLINKRIDELRIRIFKYLTENYVMKPITKEPQKIGEPLEDKLKKWKKPDIEDLINKLPL